MALEILSIYTLPSIAEGYPPPLVRLTIPPAVLPPLALKLIVPGFQLTLISLALLPPIAVLILTLYLADGTEVVTLKTTDVFDTL